MQDDNQKPPSAPVPTDEHSFASGAKRSKVMPFYSAIPARSLERVALRATGAPKGETLEKDGFEYQGGSRGYGYGNWMRGLPFEDTWNHVINHLLRWKDSIMAGEVPKDDELAAAAWGILMPLMRFETVYVEQVRYRNGVTYTDDTLSKAHTAQAIDKAMRDRFGEQLLLMPLSPEAPKTAPADPLQYLKDVNRMYKEAFPVPTECGVMEAVGGHGRIHRCTRPLGHDGPHVHGDVSWGHDKHETAPAAIRRTARLSDAVPPYRGDLPPLSPEHGYRFCDCVRKERDTKYSSVRAEINSYMGMPVTASLNCEECNGKGLIAL